MNAGDRTCTGDRRCQSCGRAYTVGESPFWHNDSYCSPECGGVWDLIKTFAETYPGRKPSTAEERLALEQWISSGLDLLDALGVQAEYGSLPVFDPPPQFNDDLTPEERAGYLCARLGLPNIRLLSRPLLNMAGYFTGEFEPKPGDYNAFELPNEPPPKPEGPLGGTVVISESHAYGAPAGAVIAHELAHAYLYFLRLQGVYFWLGHEAFTDLASVALGLGKLYLNAIAEQEIGYLARESYARAYQEFCKRGEIDPQVAVSGLSQAAVALLSTGNAQCAHLVAGRDLDSQGVSASSRLRRRRFAELIDSLKVKEHVRNLKADAQWLYRYGVPAASSQAFQDLDRELQKQLVLLAAQEGDSDIRAVLTWLVERYRPDLSHLLQGDVGPTV